MKLRFGVVAYFFIFCLFVYLLVYYIEHYEGYYPTKLDMLRNPIKYDLYNISFRGVMANRTSTSFYLSNLDSKILYNDVEDFTGQQVSVFARFHKEGFFEALDIHVHKHMNWVYFLSIVAIFWLLFIFLREWRITKRGFENA